MFFSWSLFENCYLTAIQLFSSLGGVFSKVVDGLKRAQCHCFNSYLTPLTAFFYADLSKDYSRIRRGVCMCVCIILKRFFFLYFLRGYKLCCTMALLKMKLAFFSCRISYNCVRTGLYHSEEMDKWHAGKDCSVL